MGNSLNILRESPHDLSTAQIDTPKPKSETIRWVPSRYNIRASTEDGRLIVWNTFRGSMSVFRSHQVAKLLPMLRRPGFEAKSEGIVKYLADRGFILEHDANEYRQVQVAIGQQHFRTNRLELILLASEDCNFRCRYCYEKFARGTMIPEARRGVKSLVLKRLKQLSSLQVSWFGGEPLYGFKAIEDLAPFFLQVAEENELHYSASMTTNGYLLTTEVADNLLAWKINNFQITLDGVPEDHDHSRPTRDGHGTFETIFDNLVSLSRRPDRFGVSIRVNFDRDNHPRLSQFLAELEKHFAHDPRFALHFFPVGRWGGPQDTDLNVCGTREAEQAEHALKAEARRRGIRVGNLKGINQVGAEVCYAARPYNLIIGATGKVMKCTIVLDTEDHNVVGTLTEDGELRLNDDRFALWTEPAYENDSQCQKCVILPICQGTHCPLIRIVENKSPCCSARTHAKEELLELLENEPGARKAMVESSAEINVRAHAQL